MIDGWEAGELGSEKALFWVLGSGSCPSGIEVPNAFHGLKVLGKELELRSHRASEIRTAEGSTQKTGMQSVITNSKWEMTDE